MNHYAVKYLHQQTTDSVYLSLKLQLSVNSVKCSHKDSNLYPRCNEISFLLKVYTTFVATTFDKHNRTAVLQ